MSFQFVTLSELRSLAHAGSHLPARELLRVLPYSEDGAYTIALLPDATDPQDLYTVWHGPADALVWWDGVFGPLDSRGYRRDSSGPWAALRRVEVAGREYWLPYWPLVRV